MKYLMMLGLIVVFGACKMTEKDLDEFDMSKYCDKYHVLKYKGNNSCYFFVERDRKKYKRFVIFKDFNQNNTGFGFAYAEYADGNVALKHGVFKTADEAIELAEKNCTQRVLGMSELRYNGEGQWLSMGEEMYEVCDYKN